MKTCWKVLLSLVVVICFAVALSYPIRYRMEEAENEANMAKLAAIREAGRQAGEEAEAPEASAQPVSEASVNPRLAEAPEASAQPAVEVSDNPRLTEAPETPSRPQLAEAYETSAQPFIEENVVPLRTELPVAEGLVSTPAPQTSEPTITPEPTATPDRRARTGALAYPDKEKSVLNEADILPEYRELYEMNHDFVGWLTIPGTKIDYPVVQCEDSEYYLTHDFFGKENKNGQIILDKSCDPYTPSYNLVLSGHNMFNENMFGPLLEFVSANYWKRHKTLEFDVLTEKRQYVIFAAFASADYDVDEEGFRYNADIQYRVDAEKWLKEIRESQMYDTEIDVTFGDEFLTLTTCNNRFRENGRMVLVCRRIRDGEEFE